MSTCNLPTLQADACSNKFSCLDEKTARAVELQLLCDLKNRLPATVGQFCSMSLYNEVTINGGAGAYAPITNFQTHVTNGFTTNLVTGITSPSIAGYYRIGIHLSGKAGDISATIEGDFLIDGVQQDAISFITVFDPSAPRTKDMSAVGILYCPAGSALSFQVKSDKANGITIYRAQYAIGSA